jgi:hypothetical protein
VDGDQWHTDPCAETEPDSISSLGRRPTDALRHACSTMTICIMSIVVQESPRGAARYRLGWFGGSGGATV